VRALVEEGIAVLALDWRSLGRSDRLTMQGLASVGVSHLAEQAEIDGERVGIVGVGLGGDLALRSAAMDSDVAAVLAIEPVLSGRRPMLGIEALRGLSWFGAQLRARRWRRSPLAKALDALSAVPRVAPRPVAIVVGSAGGPNSVGTLEILQVAGGCPLIPAAHEEAVQRAAQWFAEHLA
jgi:dienelactone hydrolase